MYTCAYSEPPCSTTPGRIAPGRESEPLQQGPAPAIRFDHDGQKGLESAIPRLRDRMRQQPGTHAPAMPDFVHVAAELGGTAQCRPPPPVWTEREWDTICTPLRPIADHASESRRCVRRRKTERMGRFGQTPGKAVIRKFRIARSALWTATLAKWRAFLLLRGGDRTAFKLRRCAEGAGTCGERRRTVPRPYNGEEQPPYRVAGFPRGRSPTPPCSPAGQGPSCRVASIQPATIVCLGAGHSATGDE